MFDPSQALAGWRIPTDLLIALDNRSLHFALQPTHYLVRALHVTAMAAFFGGIVLLDLRLMGVRATAPLRTFSEHALPWLWITFAVTLATGVALFLYDPVHVGSHAYFTLKLGFIALGLVNAAFFHRDGYQAAQGAAARMPLRARIAGATSLIFWLAVMLAASLNVEGPPKVLL